MALHYVYSDATGSTIDITDRCQVSILSVTDQAEEGAVAISNLVIDDPDGDLEITGHRRIYIYEDSAPVDNQVIFNGFTFGERVRRGPYRTGRGRQWTVSLEDVNCLINRRIMNGPGADRPAENDTDRILALFGMTEFNTVDDDSMVNLTATTVDMDAAPYEGQNVGQYIDDCRQASGKNAYIYYNEPLGEYGLWYDFAESTEYDSECFLTNTVGEEDGETVFLYSQERTELNNDPTRVASGNWMEFDGPGSPSYVLNDDTVDRFAPIDVASPSVNVKTLAKAQARQARYLVDSASELQVIHVVLTKVPRSSVNAIKKGHLVKFKSSYMTGFEDYRQCRVLFRTVTEISEDPTNSFEIEMDLDPVPAEPMCITAENTVVENGGRDAISGQIDSGITDLRGTTWAYVATNPLHDPLAITSVHNPVNPINSTFTWRFYVMQGPASGGGTSIGSPGVLDTMVNLSPTTSGTQGSTPPFTALLPQTGTFTVPMTLDNPDPYGFFAFQVTVDYAPGVVTIDEGYEVCLTRIS